MIQIISVILLFIVGCILIFASRTMDDLDLVDSADSTYSEFSILVLFFGWIGKKFKLKHPLKVAVLLVGMLMIVFAIVWVFLIY